MALAAAPRTVCPFCYEAREAQDARLTKKNNLFFVLFLLYITKPKIFYSMFRTLGQMSMRWKYKIYNFLDLLTYYDSIFIEELYHVFD